MLFAVKRQGFFALALSASLLAGCGAPQALTQPAPGARSVQNMTEAEKKKEMDAFLEKLELTEDQKTQLKALKDEFKAGIDMDEVKELHTQMKELLKADEVDKAKLTTLLTEATAKKQAYLTKAVDMMVKVREILTEEQRQTVAVAILDKFGERRAGKGKKKDDLGLTRGQRQAFMGMRHVKRSMMAAVGSFMLTGDKEALTTAFTLKDRAAMVEKMAGVLAGMTKAQREKLVTKIEKAHEKRVPKDDDTDEVAEETPVATPTTEAAS